MKYNMIDYMIEYENVKEYNDMYDFLEKHKEDYYNIRKINCWPTGNFFHITAENEYIKEAILSVFSIGKNSFVEYQERHTEIKCKIISVQEYKNLYSADGQLEFSF